MSVARNLKRNKYHPYRVQRVQELHGNDCDRHEEFFDWKTQELVQPSIYYNVMFRDEAIFHLSGMVNHHNCHYWVNENPDWTEETHVQNDPRVMVWCGIHETTSLRPYFFEATNWRNICSNVE